MTEMTVEQYKSVVLEIMIEVDRICRENNLRYQISFGTLLGAIRHKGFIPWDDDIDIIMPREDYDKLRLIINREKHDYLRFISSEDYPDTIYPYGKVCDTRTFLDEVNFKKVHDYGAFVDIFPLYHVFHNRFLYMLFRYVFRTEMILLTHSARVGYEKTDSKKTNLLRFFAYRLCKLLNPNKMVVHMENRFKLLDKIKTDRIGYYWDDAIQNYPKNLFDDSVEVEFEGYMLYAPKDYEKILSDTYGDYMKLPEEEKRISNHKLNCYYR